ncbi:MAG: transposase [Deltaproteobacteria bacterium]|nr:transposase [Deltaproteobacteria bacterium]
MSDYRRARGGSTYFFTVVTYKRQPILCLADSIKALREAISEVKEERPFEVNAWVLLPDHLHCVWELPEGDLDYSVRWALIKKGFTKRMKGLVETPLPNLSRIKHRESSVWQRRFWEHQIRDEADLRRHCDYIHYNPVKHGLVDSPKDWKHSTFHRYVEAGLYPNDWGGGEADLPGVGSE